MKKTKNISNICKTQMYPLINYNVMEYIELSFSLFFKLNPHFKDLNVSERNTHFIINIVAQESRLFETVVSSARLCLVVSERADRW